jgi:hypothetical protein
VPEVPNTKTSGMPSGTATTATRNRATAIPLRAPSTTVQNPWRGSTLLSLNPTAAKTAHMPVRVSAK